MKHKKDQQAIGNLYTTLIVERKYEDYFDWFAGGEDHDEGSGGLYRGVKGKDAVKNQILDSWSADNEEEDAVYIANAIDTLSDDQLLRLVLLNYNGTPVASMPPYIQEFGAHDSNAKYFEAPDVKDAVGQIRKAIEYFKSDTDLEMPEWAATRDSYY